MRVQILPLPTIRVDGYESTPFVMVLDGVDADDFDVEELDHMKQMTHATAVWVVRGELNVGTPLELTDEMRDSILDQLTRRAAPHSAH